MQTLPKQTLTASILIAGLVGLSATAHAATVTWDGGDTVGLWNSGFQDNWDTDSNPVSGSDSVVMTEDGIGQANLNGTAFTVGSGQSITVEVGGAASHPVLRLDTAGDLTIGSGGSLNFGLNGQLTNQSTGSLTIDAGATAADTWRYFTGTTGATNFVANSAGVTTFNTGTFFFGGGILGVDLTNYDDINGDTLTLFNYTNDIGSTTFDSITVTGIGGGSWTQGVNYTIDYGSAGGSINLTIVPEPSSFALISGCLALGAIMMRRRQN